jgi:predicted nuclease of predicted toxin-antitoxin system
VRFIVDECTGPSVAAWLRGEGHDVLSVFDDRRGARDDEVLALSVSEARIIITNDKDFGEMVFRRHLSHPGLVLLRLSDERAANKIAVLRRLLAQFGPRIPGSFVVATERAVRFGSG